MKVVFNGVRGSIPTAGPKTAKFGGNTSSVLVIPDKTDDVAVFDAGTGIRICGEMVSQLKRSKIHLFITHSHWDHIQGLPFFEQLYNPNATITIYGPAGLGRPFEDILMLQMQKIYFPVRRSELRAKIKFAELQEENFMAGSFAVVTKKANHPVSALSYRIECEGKSVVYTGDHEPFRYMHHYAPPDKENQATQTTRIIIAREDETTLENRWADFVAKADLLIADSQYTDQEYISEKTGWGHSPLNYVVGYAARTEVRNVAMHHHEPRRSDDELEGFEKTAKKLMKDKNSKIQLFAAKEGMTFSV